MYITIGVIAMDVDEVNDGIKEVDVLHDISNFQKKFNVSVTIEDLRNEFKKMDSFLKENALEDDNPFFREFDIDRFGILIQFQIVSLKDLEILETNLLTIAKELSAIMQTETILMIDDFKIPVALFKQGKLLDTFTKYSYVFWQKHS
ncbi:MAG: hypothetical protein EOO43_06375 [Flavobacterium sp.]|nr:MAG: hypothetical protein EOO43_06375 [Flavobacterium sp.]